MSKKSTVTDRRCPKLVVKKKKRKRCLNFVRWTVSKDHLHGLTPKLLNDKTEQAGAFLFKRRDHVSSHVVMNSEGQTDSVFIRIGRDHVLSFHTHPAVAYVQAECVYGHPSGDDLREFVTLSQRGVLNHAVLTLEGIYVVQIHPKFVEYFRSLESSDQDQIRESIYVRFRKYHGKRMLTNVKKHRYDPCVFVDACNKFRLRDVWKKSRYDKRIFSCVFFFADNYLQYKKDPDKLWERIKDRTLPVTYTTDTEVSFKFLELEPEDRTLSNIMETMHECCRGTF